MVKDLKASFGSHQSRDLQDRKTQLKALYRMMEEGFEQLAAAVHKDLRKNRAELDLYEVAMIKTEIVDMIESKRKRREEERKVKEEEEIEEDDRGEEKGVD